MELSEILNSLSSGTEKTASVEEGSTRSSSLSEAIDRALSSDIGAEKTASVSAAPEADLMKIASDLANAEQDAIIKEAHIYGAAVADGFVSRLSAYQPASSSVKTASAHSDEAMIKHAMDMGYRNTMQAMAAANNQPGQVKVAHEKLAQVKTAAFEKGRQDAVKVSSYYKGQQDAVKVAEHFNKVAASYEDLGFRVGNNILASLAG